MAITLSAPDAQRVVVEPLTAYQLALYVAPAYTQRRGAPLDVRDLTQHPIVGYIEDLIYAPELRYLEEILPGLSPTLASSSIQAQRAIITAGAAWGSCPASWPRACGASWTTRCCWSGASGSAPTPTCTPLPASAVSAAGFVA